MKPIPVFVVAPRIVIASPMFGMARERTKLIKTKTNVAKTFYLLENFFSGSRKSSSRVSLQGRIVKGVANKITVKIPKSEI